MRRTSPVRYGLASVLALLFLLLVFAGCAKRDAKSPPQSPPANSPSSETTSPGQDPLVFAVAGDSRSAHAWLNPADSPDYKKYLSQKTFAALRDDLLKNWRNTPGFFLVHLGDFGIRGGQKPLDAVQDLLAPMKAANIPVYPAIGNHELRYYQPACQWDEKHKKCAKHKKDADEKNHTASQHGYKGSVGGAEAPVNALLAQNEYQAAVYEATTPSAVTMPAGASFLSGYEGLAYSFKRGSTAFIVMDSYYVSGEGAPTYMKGYYPDVQLKWLQDTLIAFRQEGSGVSNVFVISHQPAFNAATGSGAFYDKYDSGKSGPSGHRAQRSNWIMWALMNKYKVDAYFCGHSHFYHRWNVQGTKFAHTYDAANWGSLDSTFDASGIKEYTSADFSGWPHQIPQVLNGTCGAPLQSLTKDLVKHPIPAEHSKEAYNYSVVTVNGGVITVDVYAYRLKKGKTQREQIDKFEKRDGTWKTLPFPKPSW